MKRLVSLFLVLVATLSVVGCSVAGATRISFPSAVDQNRAFPEPQVKVPGYLAKPDGGGPFPAMVLLHGCDGVGSREAGWAAELKKMGIAALIVDSLWARGSGSICASGSRGITPYARAQDAIGGLAYLAKQPFVDPERIGVMGWSHGGEVVRNLMTVENSHWLRLAGGKQFRVGVAFSPPCLMSWAFFKFQPGKFLILAGGADQWTGTCETYTQAGARVHVLPGAHHSFDNPAAPSTPVQTRGALYPGSTSATVGYSASAAERAGEFVRQFLQEKLLTPQPRAQK